MRRASCSPGTRVAGGLIASIAFAAIVVAGMLAPRPPSVIAAPTRMLASAESSTTTSVPLPLQMAKVGTCEQLLIATAKKLSSTTGTLHVFEKVDGAWVETLTVAARFGKHGLVDGTRRKAGSKMTPTGIWSMPDFVFGTHRHPFSGTKMKYRQITSRSWWSSRRGKTYNTWVEARYWTGEHLASSPTAYEFAVSMGYNAKPNPSVYGRGSGMFLHVRMSGLTSGCVSISRADIIRIFKILDPKKHPHFAIGTLQRGASTSIWAY